MTTSASINNNPISNMKKSSGKRVIFASAFGNALEFFDFTVYNFFVIYIGALFFPASSDKNMGLLLAFATLGVSFFMRPLGGIIIGTYADKFGRKPAMVLTISLMSLGTLLVGIAPTYATAGYLGTLVLVTARLIQGVAAGGEVGASMSMLVESAPHNRRGFYSSWQLATQGVAVIFGGGIALLLTRYLPVITDNPNVMSEWGWRIPFFIGVLLAPIGCWLRLGLENEHKTIIEKPRENQPHQNIFWLLKENLFNLVAGILLVIGSTVATYISIYYYSTYAIASFNMPTEVGYAAMLLAGVITFLGSLYAGILSDKYGRKKLIWISRIVLTILAYPSFWLISTYHSPAVLLLTVFVMVFFTTLGAAPTMLVISELLPTRIRALGFALVYSIGVAVFGGFAQYFATLLVDLTGIATSPSWYLGGAVFISSFSMFMFKEQKHLRH
ncbi:MFS transporter [Utexia brackfieldae]|uniref:MFS transporter n=1 Tax=Utexia brackfieldae TaxID=3074108 RepID=UPI00370DBC5F